MVIVVDKSEEWLVIEFEMKKNVGSMRVLFVFVKWSDDIENNLNVVSSNGKDSVSLEYGEIFIMSFGKILRI